MSKNDSNRSEKEEYSPLLCGFIWCHGDKDFSIWETDAIAKEDRDKIEKILMKYESTGTGVRNCWDSKFSEVLCARY